MTDPTASPFSAVAGYPDQVINPAPFVPTYVQDDTDLVISWPAVTGAWFYEVYAGRSQSDMPLQVTNLLDTGYTLSNLAANTMYFVQIVAWLGVERSVSSVPKPIKRQIVPPTTVATPTLSPPAGTYPSTQTITITSTTPGALIFYSTDGSTPSTNSTAYTGPVSVPATATLRAIAYVSTVASAVASAYYVVNAAPTFVAAPQFSPTPATYTSSQSVTLTTSTSGASIYYTTDNTDPTTASTLYTGAITTASPTTFRAIAYKLGTYSTVTPGTYIINTPPVTVMAPVASPVAGTYTSSRSVTLTSGTVGAAIYYTTNGTVPTTSSTLYTGAFTVASSSTVRSVAYLNGTYSTVTDTTYVISVPLFPPTFSGALTISPSVMRVGVLTTANTPTVSASPPATLSYQWRTTTPETQTQLTSQTAVNGTPYNGTGPVSTGPYGFTLAAWASNWIQSGGYTATLLRGDVSGCVTMRVNGNNLVITAGGPNVGGAPVTFIGQNYNAVSANNPFYIGTDQMRSINAMSSFTGNVRVTTKPAKAGTAVAAWQSYLFQTVTNGNNVYGNLHLDMQIQIARQSFTYEVPNTVATNVTIGGTFFSSVGWRQNSASQFLWVFSRPNVENDTIDFKAIAAWLLPRWNATRGTNWTDFYIGQMQVWVEPTAGNFEFEVSNMQININGTNYGFNTPATTTTTVSTASTYTPLSNAGSVVNLTATATNSQGSASVSLSPAVTIQP